MPTTITIDISEVQDLIERLADFRRTVIEFIQIGLERFVMPRLKAAIPVRTGRLQASRIFVPQAGGGYFSWLPSGFYWRFQRGLPQEQQAIVRNVLPQVMRWAVQQARSKLKI